MRKVILACGACALVVVVLNTLRMFRHRILDGRYADEILWLSLWLSVAVVVIVLFLIICMLFHRKRLAMRGSPHHRRSLSSRSGDEEGGFVMRRPECRGTGRAPLVLAHNRPGSYPVAGDGYGPPVATNGTRQEPYWIDDRRQAPVEEY
ncbi:unnamed protein product, partial [Cyprideis torosa]